MIESELILVVEYATQKHKGQLRKDKITPYITHPISVSNIVKKYGGSLEQQAAGLLHDVVEDCNTSFEQLSYDLQKIIQDKETVKSIVEMVDDLTGKITPEKYPKLNRAQRKKMEIAEFRKMDNINSRIVKLADIIDNMSSIENLPEDFAELYVFEDFRIIRALKIEQPKLLRKLLVKCYE